MIPPFKKLILNPLQHVDAADPNPSITLILTEPVPFRLQT